LASVCLWFFWSRGWDIATWTMKLFRLLAFGLRSKISYLPDYLWSEWAPAIAKTQLNVALGTGPWMEWDQAWGEHQCFSITETLWTAVVLELCSGHSWPWPWNGLRFTMHEVPNCLWALFFFLLHVSQWDALRSVLAQAWHFEARFCLMIPREADHIVLLWWQSKAMASSSLIIYCAPICPIPIKCKEYKSRKRKQSDCLKNNTIWVIHRNSGYKHLWNRAFIISMLGALLLIIDSAQQSFCLSCSEACRAHTDGSICLCTTPVLFSLLMAILCAFRDL
jgi:hypothetical protein